MISIRTTARGFVMALLTAVVTGPPSHAVANAAVDSGVLAAREAAWRAYFGGDVGALGDLLPPEFIGISMNEGPFADRQETLEGARAFRERGGRLVRLAFPETKAQRMGDVVVLYGRYEAVIESGGVERTLRGRLTEVFVRREGRWLHPGWHLDLTGVPAPAP
ncbi:MAG TPA: nuclear transport factor 2 family protein [Vicinamibacteria bacterium]